MLLAELRTARAWGVPHSTIHGSENPGRWTGPDRQLAVGLTLYEADLGPCGHPHSVSTDDEMDGWYDVDDDTTCHACAARDRWARENQEPPPGALVGVINTRPTPLPPSQAATNN